MITYGVVPRLIALMICLWRQHVALRWALVHTPGAAEVLDRLNSPIVETAAADAIPPLQLSALHQSLMSAVLEHLCPAQHHRLLAGRGDHMGQCACA